MIVNEDLLNVMGSFSETALDCIEKQNEEIEDLKKENARLKDKIDKYIEIIENLYSESEISKYQYEKYMSIAKEN